MKHLYSINFICLCIFVIYVLLPNQINKSKSND